MIHPSPQSRPPAPPRPSARLALAATRLTATRLTATRLTASLLAALPLAAILLHTDLFQDIDTFIVPITSRNRSQEIADEVRSQWSGPDAVEKMAQFYANHSKEETKKINRSEFRGMDPAGFC